MTSVELTSNYSVPPLVAARSTPTADQLSWTVLTPAVVDRNGTSMRALKTSLKDERWSWGLNLDDRGQLVDSENRTLEDSGTNIGLLLNSSTIVPPIIVDNATLLIRRTNGSAASPGRNTTDVDSFNATIEAYFRDVRLAGNYSNGTWTLWLPTRLLNSTLAELVPFVGGDFNISTGTPSLVPATAFPGVYVNLTTSYIKLVATNNRGLQAWEVDVPQSFGTVDVDGTFLLLGGPARDLVVLLAHDWVRNNFSVWFLPVTEGFPVLYGDISPFVDVRQLVVVVQPTQGQNGTNVTATLVEERSGYAFPTAFAGRPAFRSSLLAPQLTEDGAFLYAVSVNRSVNRTCMLRFDIAEATNTFFAVARDPSTDVGGRNRILAQCRTIPGFSFDRWQLLDTAPELLNAERAPRLAPNGTLPLASEIQLIMTSNILGITLFRWVDIDPRYLAVLGGQFPPNWTTTLIPGFSRDADLVPASWGLNVSYTVNVSVPYDSSNPVLQFLGNTTNVTRHGVSNKTLLYVLSADSLQLLSSNVTILDSDRQLKPIWHKNFTELWPSPPPSDLLVAPRRNSILFASSTVLGLCLGVNMTSNIGHLVFVDARSGKPFRYRPFYLPCVPEKGSLLVTNGTWDRGLQRPTSNLTVILAQPDNNLTILSLPCRSNGEPLAQATLEVQYSIPQGIFPPAVVFPPNQILLDSTAFGAAYTPPSTDPISGQIIAGVANSTFGIIIALMVLVVGAAIGLGVWFLRGNRFGKKTHPTKGSGGMVTVASSRTGSASPARMSPSMANSASHVPLAGDIAIDEATMANTPRTSRDGLTVDALERTEHSPTPASRDLRLAAALAAARVVSSLRTVGRDDGQPVPDEEHGLGISGVPATHATNAPAQIAVTPAAEATSASGETESTYNWNNDPQLAGAMMMRRRGTTPTFPLSRVAEESSMPVVVRTSLDGAVATAVTSSSAPTYIDLGANSPALPPLAPVDPRSSTARMARSPLVTHRYTLSDGVASGATVVSSGSLTDPDVDEGIAQRESYTVQSVPSSSGLRTAADELGSCSSSIRAVR